MSADLRELARLLGGRTAGGKFHSICCPAHHDANPSASIWLANDGRLGGRCFAECSAQAVLAAISQQTGLIAADGTFLAAAPGPAWQTRSGEAEDIEAEIAEAKELLKRVRLAERIWSETHEAVAGSLVARYLRETRGLDPSNIPNALRYHPSLWHGRSQTSWPAMVAPVVDVDGALIGVHRTWLDAESNNKAPVDPPRAALGPIGGGAIRLWDEAGSDDLMVAEGIETALAAGQLAGWRYPVWAGISAGGMEALALPKQIKRVAILADHDAGGAGKKAAKILKRRLRKRGVRVVILPPNPGEDFNDILLAKRDARQGAA
jgi:hypothetical protein